MSTGLLLRAAGRLASAWLGFALATAAAQTPAADALQALQLEGLAVTLMRAGQPREAVLPARQAAELRSRAQPADPLAQARSLATLGEIERDLDRFDAARAALEQSLALRSAALPAGHRLLADSRHKLGVLQMSLGRPDLAAGHFGAAVEALRSGGDSVELVATLGDQAGARVADGQLAAAEQSLAEAARRLPRLRPHEAEALRGELLLREAELAQRLGDGARADALLVQALALRRETPAAHPLDLAATLAAAAEGHLAAGRYGEAMATQRESAALFLQVRGPMHTDIARGEQAMGEILRAAGDLDGARQRLRRALEQRGALLPPEHPDIARTLGSLGLVALESGRIDEAIGHFDAALAIWRQRPGWRYERAATLHNRAASLLESGRHADAEKAFAAALAQWREAGAAPRYLAVSLAQRAQSLDGLRRHDEARPLHEEALALLLGRGDAPLELALALDRYAEHHAARGDTLQAIYFGKEAVNQLQRLGAAWGGADASLQRSFLRQRQDVYQRLAARLIEAGRFAEAEQVLGMLKQSELREILRSGDSTDRVDFTGGEAALARDRAAIDSAVAEYVELDALQRKSARQDLDAAERARRAELQSRMQGWREAFMRWTTKVRDALSRSREAPPAETAAALPARASELQFALQADPGSVAVHYVVTDNALAVLFVTPDGEFGTLVEVSRAELNQRIAELRAAIRDRKDVLPAAQALHRWLIAPIEPQLQRTGATTLVLSLTGSLRYLPFAALHDGKRYLVERIPLVVWAQAGQAGGAPKRDDWQVAAMGASRGGAGFTALPGVPMELDSIVRDPGGAKGVLPGRILLDQAFDREALYDALGRYNVAHIASHFEFRPGDESRSVLLLGDGQTMSLGQLAVLPFRNVQLLALSACNTATGGGVNEHGIEVEGLAAVVQRRGARSVLASLWAVSDASTARLMSGFYRDHPQGLARALQQAQLAMLRSGGSAASANANDEAERGVRRPAGAPPAAASGWAHPYHWAAFVLSGQWR